MYREEEKEYFGGREASLDIGQTGQHLPFFQLVLRKAPTLFWAIMKYGKGRRLSH